MAAPGHSHLGTAEPSTLEPSDGGTASTGPNRELLVMEIIACPDPECRAYAEVVDRWSVPSTDGPVEHIQTRCLSRHLFTVPIEYVRWTPAAHRWMDVLPRQHEAPSPLVEEAPHEPSRRGSAADRR